MFKQLTELIAIAFYSFHRGGGFNDQQPQGALIELYIVNHCAWDNHVITLAEIESSKLGEKGAAAIVYEQHLIALGVLIEVIHLPFFR